MIPILILKLLFLVFGTLRPGCLTYNQYTIDGALGCKGWIKYWIVYAMVIGFWSITDILFFWLPFYEELKFTLMVWLYVAPPYGSEVLFDHIIFPLMVRNENILGIVMNEGTKQMLDGLRNVLRLVCVSMWRSILPFVINTICIQLYLVLVSEVRNVLFKSHRNEVNMTASVVERESETEIEESSIDVWQEALNVQLPEEDNDGATHVKYNPLLHVSEPTNKDNGNNKNNNTSKGIWAFFK